MRRGCERPGSWCGLFGDGVTELLPPSGGQRILGQYPLGGSRFDGGELSDVADESVKLASASQCVVCRHVH